MIKIHIKIINNNNYNSNNNNTFNNNINYNNNFNNINFRVYQLGIPQFGVD